jgi:hypothetical protein
LLLNLRYYWISGRALRLALPQHEEFG